MIRLVSRLAPLVDHARVHRLEHVELTLLGIHLTDPGWSGTQSALLQRPLTAWPGLELKVNAIDFSFWCVPAGEEAAATQVGNGTAVTCACWAYWPTKSWAGREPGWRRRAGTRRWRP